MSGTYNEGVVMNGEPPPGFTSGGTVTGGAVAAITGAGDETETAPPAPGALVAGTCPRAQAANNTHNPTEPAAVKPRKFMVKVSATAKPLVKLNPHIPPSLSDGSSRPVPNSANSVNPVKKRGSPVETPPIQSSNPKRLLPGLAS